ncbi:neutral/alkaline ceramidase [Pyxidicoccus caerfyrddinensis]|uniref:neutral/alkaline ceramidase n=1 Tax=Pyxidicoccus caerfyrddinensis TaxID=2709663 RepID=UPI0013DB0ACD|nr:neutral/alkaline non-lysosomal ceramidase N-terminal domain-containing protein [Pyxidicoccus caerfyrddinensis]
MQACLARQSYLWVLALVLGACGAEVVEPASEAGRAPPSVASVEQPALTGPCAGNTAFQVGAGVYDITGPAAELGMMGYAMLEQKTAGIHQRLRSRAFVIASPCNGKRVAFVSADAGFVGQGVKQQVVERLKATYGSTYSDDNVVLSATHTHSGPGGFSHYALYNLTILGYDKQNFDAIVDGIYQSIVRAHGNLTAGTVRLASNDLLNTSINRSPEAYLRNPATERGQFGYDTDKQMTLLRLQTSTGQEVGLINWFAVHATSMGNDNLLISGDNKGYASYLFEKLKGTNYTAAKTFVAAFAQSNEGDVTPNIYGGTNGGGANDFESTELSGRKQYDLARALYDGAAQSLTGAVDYRHAYVKMDEVQVAPAYTDGVARTTCEAAIGISMLAGAEDGPGYGSEGATCEDIHDLWGAISCAVTTTPCQGEKPIVLEMGTMQPYPWTPEVLPLQVVTVGNVALVAVPFEMTTMAGRRLRKTVQAQLAPLGVDTVVIAGLSNAYAGYLATREEYAKQDYEGASTHFGPWQLAAVQQEADRLAAALRNGVSVPAGPTPRDLRNEQTTVQTGVVFDDKLLSVSFGSVVTNALASYARGATVSVKFWGGHPKNNLRRQGSFLQVQRKSGTSWVTVANDWDWETKYRWERNNCVPTFACSHVTVEWKIPTDAVPGTYRIRHDGDWKSGWDGLIRAYTGYSREFTVN